MKAHTAAPGKRGLWPRSSSSPDVDAAQGHIEIGGVHLMAFPTAFAVNPTRNHEANREILQRIQQFWLIKF